MAWNEIFVEIVSVLGVLGVAAITGVTSWKVNRIGKDVEVTREQTENEHSEAKYANLRNELTATRETLETFVEAQGRTNERAEAYIKDVDKSLRGLDKSLDRKIARTEAQLEEMPQLIETAIKTHSVKCPWQTPH